MKMNNIIEYFRSDDTSRWLRLLSLFVGVFVETRWFVDKKYDMQLILMTIVAAIVLGHMVKF
jgi:hypothetical protein